MEDVNMIKSNDTIVSKWNRIGDDILKARELDKLLDNLKSELDNIDDIESSDFNFTLGKIEAVSKYRDEDHEKLIDTLLKYKRHLDEIVEMEGMKHEVFYMKGITSGILSILKINRQLFKKQPYFGLYIYSMINEAEQYKYELALSLSREFTRLEDVINETTGADGTTGDNLSNLTYTFDCDIDSLCSKLKTTKELADSLDRDYSYAILILVGDSTDARPVIDDKYGIHANITEMSDKLNDYDIGDGSNIYVAYVSRAQREGKSAKDVLRAVLKDTYIA